MSNGHTIAIHGARVEDMLAALAAQSAKEYSLSDTIDFAGRKYSRGDPNWAKNVLAFLGVSPMTTLRQLAGATTDAQ